jgi:hypothetical protein
MHFGRHFFRSQNLSWQGKEYYPAPKMTLSERMMSGFYAHLLLKVFTGSAHTFAHLDSFVLDKIYAFFQDALKIEHNL